MLADGPHVDDLENGADPAARQPASGRPCTASGSDAATGGLG